MNLITSHILDTSTGKPAAGITTILFHGENDDVIYYRSSVKLKKLMKANDTLISLPEQGHNGITNNPNYITEIKKILR